MFWRPSEGYGNQCVSHLRSLRHMDQPLRLVGREVLAELPIVSPCFQRQNSQDIRLMRVTYSH